MRVGPYLRPAPIRHNVSTTPRFELLKSIESDLKEKEGRKKKEEREETKRKEGGGGEEEENSPERSINYNEVFETFFVNERERKLGLGFPSRRRKQLKVLRGMEACETIQKFFSGRFFGTRFFL